VPTYLQHPNLYPTKTWWRLICGISAPFDLSALLAILPQADLYLQDEIQVAFHPTLTRVWSRKGRCGQRLIEAPGDNRHPSTALAWWIGAMAGSMTELRLDGQLMCSVNKCGQPWLAPNVAGASLS
jgi:hypothetical protein